MMKIQGNWKKYKLVPVYEREDGFRIHTLGIIRKLNGVILTPPYSKIIYYKRLVGGRTARAMMLLCNHLYPINREQQNDQ